jgi:hypothetical protein
MGQSQSQEIQRFVNNYVNTQAISEVISSYATETNAIVTNQQDMDVVIEATGDITGPVNLSQEIESIIDINQMIDRVDKDQLVNDLQRTISTELKDAIQRYTDGLELFSIPTNQRIRDDVLNSVDTYTRQVINTNTIDRMLLQASNYQSGRLRISAANISGPLVFSQRIQSNIIAQNLVQQVMERLLQNRDVVNLMTRAEGQIQSENVSPITEGVRGITGIIGRNINTWIFYILGAFVLIAGIIATFVFGYFFPVKIWIAILIGVASLIIAGILFAVGFIQSRAARV